MSRPASGLHRLRRSPWEVVWSALVSCGLVLFSQLAVAMVPHLFPSLSLLAMLPIAGLVFLAAIVVGRFWRRFIGVAAAAPLFVLFNILFFVFQMLRLLAADVIATLAANIVSACYKDVPVPRYDDQIPGEEDDEAVPSGSSQTRDYYLDSCWTWTPPAPAGSVGAWTGRPSPATAIQMAYNLLSEISPAGKHWTICARVSRLWEYRGNVDDAEIQHLDLVLIDMQGNAIYAEIPKEHVEAKRPLLHEEHIYTFSRFLVSPNKTKYRPVDSDYMIEIGYYPEIDKQFDMPPDFPMYTYILTPFENLPSCVGETKFPRCYRCRHSCFKCCFQSRIKPNFCYHEKIGRLERYFRS